MAQLNARTVRSWYRLHKWSSLICTALLLMACITGLPLVFEDELDALLIPHVAPAPGAADAQPARLDTMLEETQAQYPKLHPYSIAWDDDEPRVFVNMSPSDDPKRNEFRTLIFDAHTGKRLEEEKDGFQLTTFLLEMHREIFLGLGGELVMGLMALTFVVSLVSGALVYGPFMRRLEFGTYRRNGARRTRWFDLHNLLGIVTLCWASVVGATGLMNALSTPLFGLWRAQALPAVMAPYKGKAMPTRFRSVDQTVAEAATAVPGTRITAVVFPNAVYASPRHYLVWAKGKTPLTSQLFTPTLVDVETGSLTLIGGLPWYLRALEVSRPLHFGNYGGMPLKVIWALFDVALIAVLGSGVYLWLSKRRTPVERELDELVQREAVIA
jgi:uncharacterized iron-regulated membrane protein